MPILQERSHTHRNKTDSTAHILLFKSYHSKPHQPGLWQSWLNCYCHCEIGLCCSSLWICGPLSLCLIQLKCVLRALRETLKHFRRLSRAALLPLFSALHPCRPWHWTQSGRLHLYFCLPLRAAVLCCLPSVHVFLDSNVGLVCIPPTSLPKTLVACVGGLMLPLSVAPTTVSLARDSDAPLW